MKRARHGPQGVFALARRTTRRSGGRRLREGEDFAEGL